VQVSFIVLVQLDFVPVFDVAVDVWLVEEVVGAFIINFDEWDKQLVVNWSGIFDMIVEVWKNSWYDSSELPGIGPADGVGFATSRLPVGEESAVIPVEETTY
jgi:hypothetical protein